MADENINPEEHGEPVIRDKRRIDPETGDVREPEASGSGSADDAATGEAEDDSASPEAGEVLSDEPGLRVTRTGLHELEFIETRTYDIAAGRSATVRTGGEYAVLNLVAGRGATIASPTGAFEPLGIHYVETVQVPAAAGDIELIADRGEPIKVLVAQVRF